jgi:hypothetical protein
MKVLVGCPTWQGKEYLLDQYIAHLSAMDGEFDILLVDNSPTEEYAALIRAKGVACERISWREHAKERIVASRNVLRERTLEGNYDYLLSVEQDVLVQPETLKQLLSHGKSFVTTIVLTYRIIDGKQIKVPMISVPFEGRPGKLRHLAARDLTAPIIPVAQSHLACTLIGRDILQRFAFRYDDTAFDDACLSEDLRAAGVTLWCDTTLKPAHKPSSWKGVQK